MRVCVRACEYACVCVCVCVCVYALISGYHWLDVDNRSPDLPSQQVFV
jgi:hypothetical protein